MRVLLLLFTSLVGFALGSTVEPHSLDPVVRAIQWMESQRDQHFGWGGTTEFCITALQLANNSWLNEDRIDNMLTAKQLEVDMLVKFFDDFLCEPVVVAGLSQNATKEEMYNASHHLDSHKKGLMSPGKVAQFVMTLLSMCKNPKNFHGKDLVGLLQRMEPEHDFEVALHTLAICLSNGNVTKRNSRRLLKITQKDLNDQAVGRIDTYSMAIMALQCLRNSSRGGPIGTDLDDPVKTLLKSQNQDGSFGSGQNPDGSTGNVWSTGLAVQALSLYNESMGWNSTASLLWLASQQKVDGSFLGYVHATATVLPALAGTGFLDMKDYECNYHREIDAEAPVPVTEPTLGNSTDDIMDNITISYTLWFDSKASNVHSLNVTAPVNSSLYQMMEVAAGKDKKFEFSTSTSSFGHLIHTIGGIRNKPTRAEGFQFWLIYKLTNKPDPSNKPLDSDLLPVGVDDYFPEDGDFILFWFKKIDN